MKLKISIFLFFITLLFSLLIYKDYKIKTVKNKCDSGYVCGECANDINKRLYGYKSCWVDENYNDIN